MDIEKYIASGILELYIAGVLSEKENLEIYDYAKKYPEVKKEIEAIEATILDFTKKSSPGLATNSFESLKPKISKVVPLNTKDTKKAWTNYLGWAAAFVLAIGFVWMFTKNNTLQSDIKIANQEKQTLKEEIINSKEKIADTENILNQLRDKNVNVISLGGQTVAPSSFAKAYWNKEEQKKIINAQGLPESPTGYTYQVWSLKLEPLTPTNLGLLENFATNTNRVFELANANESEAFGITLEPEGGSESPTLEQLYTLGVVAP